MRENDIKETLHEIEPLDIIHPLVLWNKSFYRNFIQFLEIQSFVMECFIGKFYIGFQSSKIPLFIL
jgi:hypothetical protein